MRSKEIITTGNNKINIRAIAKTLGLSKSTTWFILKRNKCIGQHNTKKA